MYCIYWIRTFLECKEVKAVVSIGCCYNLLSEEVCESSSSQCGFPMSNVIKSAGLSLGKSSRDLACQVQFYLAFLIIVQFAMEAFKDIHLSKFVSTFCILLRIVSKMWYLLSFLFVGSWTWKKVRHHISCFMEFNSTWMQIAKVYNLLGNYVVDDPD